MDTPRRQTTTAAEPVTCPAVALTLWRQRLERIGAAAAYVRVILRLLAEPGREDDDSLAPPLATHCGYLITEQRQIWQGLDDGEPLRLVGVVVLDIVAGVIAALQRHDADVAAVWLDRVRAARTELEDACARAETRQIH